MKKIFLLALILVGLTHFGYTQCVNPNMYTSTFNINNSTTSAYTNKTVKVVVNTAALIGSSQMQISGADIRFGTSCCTQFPYWIDSTTMNTTATQIWVRIPNIPASSSYTLKMFHGSAALTSQSNLTATFPNRYILSSGSDSLTGNVSYDWFEIKAGATLKIMYGALLNISAENIIIAGSIDGFGRGHVGPVITSCASGIGPGASLLTSGCANGGGAGYGGVGGCAPIGGASSCSSVGGVAYGTANGTDIAMGSSGSTGSNGSTTGNGSGNGGAGLKLFGSQIKISGTINVSGGDGKGNTTSSSGGGGGSGGGILIQGTHVNLAGANLIAMGGKAGNGYGGCGAGGRIKIMHVLGLTGSYTSNVTGNIASTYSSPVNLFAARGANGTVYADSVYANQLIPVLSNSTFAPCGLVYFSKSSGALNDTLTWGTNADGSGTNPSNFNAGGCYYYVTNNGAPTFTGNWIVTGTNSMVIIGDGTNAGNMIFPVGSIFGVDTFYLNNNMTATINGTIYTNKPSFDIGSTVQYTSSLPQNILRGVYGNLIVSGSQKSLAGDVSVRGTLLMLNHIDGNGFNLTLGSSPTQPGTLNRISGNINGKFTRWFSSAINTSGAGLFPIGNTTNPYPVQLDFTTAPTSGGTISFEFISSAPGNLGFPIYDFTTLPIVLLNKTGINGFWRMSTGNGLNGGTYSIATTATNFFGLSSLADLRLLRRANPSGSWTIPGTSVPGSGTLASPVLKRTGITAFGGDFAMGSDSTINSLPVTLISFSALGLNQDVLLSWETAMEINNKHFEIEKLAGNQWIHIGTVKGNGNSQSLHKYTLTDALALNESNKTAYYRLKIVDFEGNAEYSKTVSVTLENNRNAQSLEVQPNPFEENLQITLNVDEPNKATATLYNLNGQQLLRKELFFTPEAPSQNWDGLADLQQGCYVLVVQFGDQKAIKKVIKQ
jgi:hypothetical protein